jgi:hypothetical protein
VTTWCIDLDGSAALCAEVTAAASEAPQAAPISALHTPPLGVGRPPAASRALLSPAYPRLRALHAAKAATDKD